MSFLSGIKKIKRLFKRGEETEKLEHRLPSEEELAKIAEEGLKEIEMKEREELAKELPEKPPYDPLKGMSPYEFVKEASLKHYKLSPVALLTKLAWWYLENTGGLPSDNSDITVALRALERYNELKQKFNQLSGMEDLATKLNKYTETIRAIKNFVDAVKGNFPPEQKEEKTSTASDVLSFLDDILRKLSGK